MKPLSYSFSVFFLLFSFSILFVSCSQESTITSPNESQTTSMAKAVVIPTVQFNHTTDTVITLPKSGKSLVVGKNMNTNQLALLDTYLQTHTISDKPATTVSPMAGYYTQTVSYWELQNAYQPTNEKTLGIWGTYDYLPQSGFYNLGFREIFINDAAGRDAAFSAGFQYQNMMLGIYNQSTAQSQMNSVNTSSIHINKVYIDEPYEDLNWLTGQPRNGHIQWSQTDIFTYAAFLQSNYPSANLYLTSYYPPYYNMSYTVAALNMAYVQCDNYYSNAVNFWNTFHSSSLGYGSKNISNWMSLEYNQSNSGYPDFSTLFGAANRLGINDIWLFAYNYGNTSLIQSYSYAAWANGWLLRQEKYLTIVYQCSGLDCNWTNQTGTWTVQTAYYTTTQYVSY